MLASTPPSALEVVRLSDQTVLRVNGHDTIDEFNSPAVFKEFSQLPDEVTAGQVVLDLGGIRYVTSTALGMLISFNRRVRLAGGRLALANAGPVIQETLAVTRLDQLLEVWPADSGLSGTAGQPA